MAQDILTETDSGVGIVTLNRPDRHNALDGPAVADLIEALSRMEADPSVRAVVVSSTGRTFCAGADEHPPETRAVAELLRRIAESGKPVVARIQGTARGCGAGIVAACDIAVATFDARFALNEDGARMPTPALVPRIIAAIGERWARRYLLTSESFSAAEAYRVGLVHEIVPDEEGLDIAVGEVVETLLESHAGAVSECKRLIAALSG